MNLQITILIEHKSVIPKGAVSGETRMSVMGGSPAPTEGPPWTAKEIKSIGAAVEKWTKAIPADATTEHQCRRNGLAHQILAGDFNFRFCFDTGDKINLEAYMNDISALSETLTKACKGKKMVVSSFFSV